MHTPFNTSTYMYKYVYALVVDLTLKVVHITTLYFILCMGSHEVTQCFIPGFPCCEVLLPYTIKIHTLGKAWNYRLVTYMRRNAKRWQQRRFGDKEMRNQSTNK